MEVNIMAPVGRFLVGRLAGILSDGLQLAGYRKNSYSHISSAIRQLWAGTTPGAIVGPPGV
jgi:hypothetical protein